jgi:hypothetical protein
MRTLGVMVAIGFLVGGARSAGACGNEVYPDQDLPTRLLLVAEKRLEAGDWDGVLRAARGYSPPRGSANAHRWGLIASVADVRIAERELPGIRERLRAAIDRIPSARECLDKMRARRSWGPVERQAIDDFLATGLVPRTRPRNDTAHVWLGECIRYPGPYDAVDELRKLIAGRFALLFALEDFDYQLKSKPDDPLLAAVRAEALALETGGAAEAERVLADLAARDLLAHPESWATLARLRDQSGDAAGARVARDRCKQLARDPAVCEAPRVHAAANP